MPQTPAVTSRTCYNVEQKFTPKASHLTYTETTCPSTPLPLCSNTSAVYDNMLKSQTYTKASCEVLPPPKRQTPAEQEQIIRNNMHQDYNDGFLKQQKTWYGHYYFTFDYNGYNKKHKPGEQLKTLSDLEKRYGIKSNEEEFELKKENTEEQIPGLSERIKLTTFSGENKPVKIPEGLITRYTEKK